MDLAGKKFGRITVVSLSHIDKNSHWNCMCDCGTEFTAIGNNLTRGKSKSCGCNKRDNVLLRLNGEDYTIAELSRKFNINKSTMKDRLRRNWSLERAVNTPVKIGEAK